MEGQERELRTNCCKEVFEPSVSCVCLTRSSEMGPWGQPLVVCFSGDVVGDCGGEEKGGIGFRQKHGNIYKYFSCYTVCLE